MGREVRKVPADWDHPKDDRGNYIPLHGYSYATQVAEWDEGHTQWGKGLRDDYNGGWKDKDDDMDYPYSEWAGRRPDEADYMPDWPDVERTHFQMYEDTSEGTPISPVKESPEDLAQWLADNGASSFGSMTATYEQWLPICQGGFAPSMVISGNRMMSGVEAMAETDSK